MSWKMNARRMAGKGQARRMRENMKLRTLKDMGFEHTFVDGRLFSEKELRQEAIKDIGLYNSLQGEGDYTDEQIEAVIEYITKKNNITEEDLE